MKPLFGTVIRTNIKKNEVVVRTSSGNHLTVSNTGRFKHGDKVRINYDYERMKVKSLKLADEPLDGTVHKDTCSHTTLELDIDDNIEDIVS